MEPRGGALGRLPRFWPVKCLTFRLHSCIAPLKRRGNQSIKPSIAQARLSAEGDGKRNGRGGYHQVITATVPL